MASAGELPREGNLIVITITAAEPIAKGKVVTIATGEVADVTAAEVGPFGVAIEAIASGAEGRVAIAPSIVYVQAGAASVTKGQLVMPAENTTTDGLISDVSTPVFNEVVGVALEAITTGAVGKIQLGYA